MLKDEQQVIDKSQWGEGIWQEEPDRLEWKHAGFPCLAVRHPRAGHWCGYVGLPPTHPLYGKEYSEPNVEVHGGLTYADACHGNVCHVPEPGEPDTVWWFGFDCAHSGDMSPGWAKLSPSIREWETYKTLDYVKQQTNALAEQFAHKEAAPCP